MTSRRREYATAAGAGLIAKVGSMAAGILGLWLLNRILEKPEFGAYSFTMAAISLITLFAAGGLNRSVLYRLSRVEGDPGKLAGGAEVVWVLRAVLATGIVSAVLAALGGIALAQGSDLPGLERWFVALAILAPLNAVGQVLAAWHQAQRKVARSLVVPRLNEISLAALLLAVWLVAPSPLGVAFAAASAAAVPLVAWLVLIPRDAFKRPRPLPPGDTAYGVKMMFTDVAERGVRSVDLLMVGLLATGALAADYALAARLVALTTLGNELLGAVFTPRMGRYFEHRDHAGLAGEYDLTRSLALALGLGVTVVFASLGQQLLSVFGDFVDARPVLLILCAAFIVKIGFGANGRYLNMSGRAGWNLFTTVLLLTAMCGLNFFLIPQYGATGAALGTLVSFAAINVLQSAVIWRKDRFPTMHARHLIVLVAAVTLLLLAAYSRLSAIPAALGLTGLALFSGRHGWPILVGLLRRRDTAGEMITEMKP